MAVFSENLRISIRMTVVSVFVIATTLTAALAIGLQFYFGHALARDAASDLYSNAATAAADQLINASVQTVNAVDLLVEYPELVNERFGEAQIRLFTTVMEQNPLFYGVYLGHEDGSFHEVINLQSREIARKALWAVPEDRWVVITVESNGEPKNRHYRYLDANLKERSSRTEPTDFNVLSRPWYVSAMAKDGHHLTEAYQFAQLKVAGQSVSRRIEGTSSVVGIDITLAGISGYLSEQLDDSSAVSFIYKADGDVIATSLQSHLYVNSLGSSLATVDEQLERLPADVLLEIARDPSRQGRMIEVSNRREPYFAFITPLAKREGGQRYFGILVPSQEVIGTFMDKVRLSIFITAGFLLLLLPLSWVFASPIVRPIRQLADENDKIRLRKYDEVNRVQARVKEVDELSESLVNMVVAIQAYEIQQRELMDSFIRLIAQAIDDKSAYTGGHCARVPELALMLAEEASNSGDDLFHDFRLDSEEQWREYRIAAWLHDCGKITTPEHIVDKGSKLETIYNRVHEVRMRFEVLWRDAEIDYWKKVVEKPEAAEDYAEEMRVTRRQLRDDFAFVAECNVGGEFLDDDRLARLKEVAARTWQRNFDDQLGLSPVEELRTPASTDELPVEERLLSDKPEHLIERTASTDYAPELGINMDVPEHLYNLGELYNLSISRGTLTAEDRFKINEHMISTIKMLEALPFPDELKNVPRYASTHHETMRGSGYPRKLPGEQLSVPERILAVADVFEALTAADRPYKKAKPVSVAVDILHKMVLDDHIDKGCFELFLRTGVYARYAEQYLAPEQLDEVDTSRYLS